MPASRRSKPPRQRAHVRRGATPRRVGGLGVLLGIAASCGPSAAQLMLDAIRLEGRTSEESCQMAFDQARGAFLLDSAAVERCLAATREVLAAYERAAQAGERGGELQAAQDRVSARIAQLEAMLAHVERIERIQREPPDAP